ncbi:MAG: hypothetical protein GWP91_04285 [Rhodobacterales bacterium]|nr:hypothetical protein [Rhodobacterales bacterium]
MPKPPTFVLPKGLELEITDDTISIRYDGDVSLETTMDRDIKEIYSGGDINLTLDKVTGTLSATGTITLDSEVQADVLHGAHIVLGDKPVKCRAISAAGSITIGAAKLAVDCIIAPTIKIDPRASGRVTVLECHNELGSSRIKGGFNLADYEDMFGNADEFLVERGLLRLADTSESTTSDPSLSEESTPEIEEIRPEEEDAEDPLSLSIDDIEDILEEEFGPEDSALQEQLSDTLARILNCYADTDVPPAVNELRILVERRDYDILRNNITELWTRLLGFHQKRGIRPHHQATHAFNLIHGLLAE